MTVRGKQRSVDVSRFAMVPRNDVPRSAFDIQHTHKTTFDGAVLVPVYVDEVLPGDSVRLKMTAFCRLATPLVPVMDNMIMETFFFYVPNRILWSNWERFMGERASITDTTEFLTPYITIGFGEVQNSTTSLNHCLADWFGITMNDATSGTINVSAFPFRAYAMIWNEWFRDQDLQSPTLFPVDDGPDTFAADYSSGFVFGLYRAKRHDYFTSARPWPQKPINSAAFSQTSFGGPFTPGGNMTNPQYGAPVSGLGVLEPAVSSVGNATWKESGARILSNDPDTYWLSSEDPFYMRTSGSGVYPDVRVLINDIRTANMVQLLMERNARGGTRYSELVRSHFGVVSPDARLQRPEYLGGGRANLSINPVAQTSATGVAGTTTVLGELAGAGTGIMQAGFSSSFVEHGWILGLLNVRADLTYQQGIERMWFRRTVFDFYWPGLAHLGEQAILSKEIYATEVAADNDTVFGYQERWSEYKYKPSRVSGVFRSTWATPLDMWHLAQHFTSRPVLNSVFIQEAPPIDRVLQVSTTESAQFLLDTFFEVRMVRPMPMFSIPGMGPHL